MNLVDLSLACSLDSLLAAAAIAGFVPERAPRWRLALAFGACDAAASALGPLLPWQPPAVPALAACIAAAWLLAQAARGRRWLLFALPLLLAFDNLGADAATRSATTAAATGLASAALAGAGFVIGSLARRSVGLVGKATGRLGWA